MVVLNAMYAKTAGKKFDLDYYRDKHMPLCKDLLGSACLGISTIAGIQGGAPGSESPYVAIGQLFFESIQSFEAAFGPKAAQIMADVPNYTDIEPLIQISDVVTLDVKIGANV